MESVSSESNVSLFERARALILRVGCEVCLTLTGQKKKARKCAQTMQYRQENCDFLGLPEALKEVKLLFLTDAHIGGNIDTIATEVAAQIHILLDGANPRKIVVLHGGDFVCSASGGGETSVDKYCTVSDHLFRGLSDYPQFGVIGNHDVENGHFPTIRKHLEDQQNVTLLEMPEDVQYVDIDGAILSIHGIHTLADALHTMDKDDRDILMDKYIDSLNSEKTDCNVVLVHNPDGLEFLLRRLRETNKVLQKPTLFLAGHTHGGMFDIPVLRDFGLRACKTQYGRYKGWYGPEGEYSDTGNWKLFVSTGMGNSQGIAYRLNAEPEITLFTLRCI